VISAYSSTSRDQRWLDNRISTSSRREVARSCATPQLLRRGALPANNAIALTPYLSVTTQLLATVRTVTPMLLLLVVVVLRLSR